MALSGNMGLFSKNKYGVNSRCETIDLQKVANDSLFIQKGMPCFGDHNICQFFLWCDDAMLNG